MGRRVAQSVKVGESSVQCGKGMKMASLHGVALQAVQDPAAQFQS